MVSESEVITTNTVCTCGSGDTENAKEGCFLNKCPVCGYKGKLGVSTLDNFELSPEEYDFDKENDKESDEQTEVPVKIRCSYCGAEFCGQDGYDLYGGTRGSLTSVNPNEVTSDNDEVSEEQEEDKTYMSGWEGLCDLLRPLDGEAMIVQRGDYVIVKKIDVPQTAKLWAYEGVNVVDDSVTITDYTPEIYNTFVIQWGESYQNELEFVFEKHKALFGERKCVLQAKRVRNVKSGDSEDSSSSTDNGWSITDLIFGSDDKSEEDSSESDNDKKTSKTNSDNKNTKSIGSENSSDEDVVSEETPITTRKEAIQFGLAQVGKAKRDDGHTIELKVIGNQNWQMGEWCHVRLPSFNEDTFMFISKCSFESSGDNEYINSLTLVDYPPSLGKPLNADKESEEDSEENTEEGSEESSNNGNTETGSNSTDT